jgi:PBSX family phage terminase large subunit
MNYFAGRCREGKYKNRDALYIHDYAGREKIILTAGGAKDGDEKYIKGNTYGCAYITEANECHAKFIQEVFDRTLSSKNRKIFHDLNPKSPGHFYYRDILYFHDSAQAADPSYGYNYGHFTIADNLSVDEEQLKTALSKYDKASLWYQMDILGKRITPHGRIYDMFDERLHVSDSSPRSYSKYYVSCDYGTQNPTVFALWGLFGDVWHMVKEYHYSGRELNRQKTDKQFADDYIDFVSGVHAAAMIVDPSAASFIAELRGRGVNVQPAKNDVIDGIRTTAGLILEGKIRINDCCKETIKEFGLYLWDERSPIERPLKENDHHMDALRYFCYTILSKTNQVQVIRRDQYGGVL